jgi:hypothetical protein
MLAIQSTTAVWKLPSLLKLLSNSYNFRVAPNTISLIINEVCDAIKTEFAAEVIQCPTTTEEGFEKRWQFPHVVE